MKLRNRFRRYFKPADDAGGGGGAVDRGDDFTPTDPEADAAAAAAATAAAQAAALAAETAAAEAAKTKDAPKDAPKDGEADPEADATKTAKKDTRIPLARHEALLTREREQNAALAARLAQYEQGAKVADLNAEVVAADTKIAGLEAEYAKLIADGHVEKAAAVMADIRRTEREMTTAQNDMKIAAAVATATESARFNIALERIEAAYPVLNPDHDDYDKELEGDVADLKTTYQRRGMTPTAALQKAVEKLVKPATAKQEAAVEVKPKVDAAAVAAERKKEAVAKTLDATGKQPPSTAKVGMDSDKDGGQIAAKDVLKMSFKDFSKLPEEELARMRGDVI